MEFRLGMWECAKCGHSEEPAADPTQRFASSPAETVKRASLIQPQGQAPVPGTVHGSGRQPGRQIRTAPLSQRLLCLACQLLVILGSHSYVFADGYVDSWLGSDYIISRVVVQAVYFFLFAVALIWRELPTKYLGLAMTVLVWAGLLAITMMAFRLFPPIPMMEGPMFPEVGPWYWTVLAVLHTGVLLWFYSIIAKDMAYSSVVKSDNQ